jgi:hypothetical protein
MGERGCVEIDILVWDVRWRLWRVSSLCFSDLSVSNLLSGGRFSRTVQFTIHTSLLHIYNAL